MCEGGRREGGREGRKKGGRGGADTELKTQTPHVNAGTKEGEGRQAPEPTKNQEIMMEHDPLSEKRNKREKGGQAPEP